jgi:hypothetical protein
MFLLDSLLMAPGKAVLFLFEELAKKAKDEFLDDETVKQELQDIYALLEAGKISEQDFESREYRLVERLQQIALAKLQEMGAEEAAAIAGAIDASVVEAPPPASPPLLPAPRASLPFGPPAADSRAELPPEGSSGGIQVQDIAPPVSPPVSAPALSPVPSPASTPGPSPASTPVTAAAPAALTMAQVIESATRGLSALKLKVSSITSVARGDDGWRVTAELVERRGVPDTSDLLGVYELQLDAAGDIVQYERTRMRRRCDLSR